MQWELCWAEGSPRGGQGPTKGGSGGRLTWQGPSSPGTRQAVGRRADAGAPNTTPGSHALDNLEAAGQGRVLPWAMCCWAPMSSEAAAGTEHSCREWRRVGGHSVVFKKL